MEITVGVRVAVHTQRRSVLLDGRRSDQVSRLDSTCRVLPAQRGRPALPTHRLHQHATPMTSARSFVMTSFKNSVYHPCCSAMSLTWKSFAELSGFKTKIPQVAISLVIPKPSFFLVTSQKRSTVKVLFGLSECLRRWFSNGSTFYDCFNFVTQDLSFFFNALLQYYQYKSFVTMRYFRQTCYVSERFVCAFTVLVFIFSIVLFPCICQYNFWLKLLFCAHCCIVHTTYTYTSSVKKQRTR